MQKFEVTVDELKWSPVKDLKGLVSVVSLQKRIWIKRTASELLLNFKVIIKMVLMNRIESGVFHLESRHQGVDWFNLSTTIFGIKAFIL